MNSGQPQVEGPNFKKPQAASSKQQAASNKLDSWYGII